MLILIDARGHGDSDKPHDVAAVNGNLNLTHLCAEPATWN
jgi:hypothetical protein